MAKAIAPDEIYERKEDFIHEDILDIVNQFLGERFSKNSPVNILQKEIVLEFISRNPEYNESKMIHDGLLDFEDAYRKQGWNVIYHRARLVGQEHYFDPYYKFTSAKN